MCKAEGLALLCQPEVCPPIRPITALLTIASSSLLPNRLNEHNSPNPQTHRLTPHQPIPPLPGSRHPPPHLRPPPPRRHGAPLSLFCRFLLPLFLFILLLPSPPLQQPSIHPAPALPRSKSQTKNPTRAPLLRLRRSFRCLRRHPRFPPLLKSKRSGPFESALPARYKRYSPSYP